MRVNALCWPISHCLKVTETISVFYCRIFLVTSALGANTQSWELGPSAGSFRVWAQSSPRYTWDITHGASSKHPITFIKTSHYFTALQCHCAVSTNLLQLKTSHSIHLKKFQFLFKLKFYNNPFPFFGNDVHFIGRHISRHTRHSAVGLTGTDWLKMLLAVLWMLLWCCWAGQPMLCWAHLQTAAPGCGLA